MSKNRKVSHKIYESWEYEREIDDLNRMSEQGWQLEKGGCFHSVFIKNDKEKYIYQIDYSPKLKDKDRYLEMFSEQEWEYINSTFNGWHYFKKAYRDDMSEEEKIIYTDKQSLYEMQNRYLSMLKFFMIISCIMTPVYLILGIIGRHTSILLEALAFLIMGVYMGIGLINVSRVRNDKSKIPHVPFIVAYPIMMIMIIFAIVLLFIQ